MAKSTTKAFDAVQMMRDARDALSARIASMSVDEQNEWLHSNQPTDPILRRLFKLAAQQAAAADGAKKRSRRG